MGTAKPGNGDPLPCRNGHWRGSSASAALAVHAPLQIDGLASIDIVLINQCCMQYIYMKQ